MNAEKRAHQIERSALRAARKVLRKEPATEFTRESLLELRIQSAPWWLRILLLGVGGGVFALGGFVAAGSSVAGGALLCFFGLMIFLIGLVGRKRTVEECVAELGGELGNAILEIVLRSLD